MHAQVGYAEAATSVRGTTPTQRMWLGTPQVAGGQAKPDRATQVIFMSQWTVPGNEPNARPWARGSLRSKSKRGAGPLTASPRHPGVSGSSQPMGRGMCTRALRGSDQARQACWCNALWQEGARGVFKDASAWLAAKSMWWSATAARGRACAPVLAAAQWAAANAAAVARSQALVAR